MVVNLYDQDAPVLIQSEGMPGVLAMTDPEFDSLQDDWEKAGLPRDLYYRSEERRLIVEPVREQGGVVRVLKGYSPLRWAQRDASNNPVIKTPSEEQRVDQFLDACRRFMEATRLRMAELSEPGRELDRETLMTLGRLHRDTLLVMDRTRTSRSSSESWLCGEYARLRSPGGSRQRWGLIVAERAAARQQRESVSG